ncbi:putative permease [Hyphomonas neptunium ATCC 15444]|uniref:Putative permease n=2 Tax=Hyphomonas TaxID=85 RepID=Q0C1U7_HYPNA|nr:MULTISPECIES: LptF/LptG family permease [Hyphomonas]ABI75469.1 putative permease [Hyphomonas neptunium ATCC 15444]KCZ92619.1 putative permease [Hyphomonas hirschiana VP5]
MFARLDRYLIRSFLGMFAGLTVLAMALLLLERLIRITEIVSGSGSAFASASLLVANLIPHYLNLALPGAFLISMILTIDRLSRSGEIVALMAAGVSLYRIVLPFVQFSLVLAAASLLISGFLQPLSRYSYREIVYNLQHQSVLSVFQEQKFVQYDNRIIWTDSVLPGGRLGQTFILESEPDGARTLLTGGSGKLREIRAGEWEITLLGGAGASYRDADPPEEYDRIEYGELSWPVIAETGQYRARGGDERELFLPELLAKAGAAMPGDIAPAVAAATFHDRTSRAALLLAMPLIAIILGLNLGRVARSSGVVLGILFLLGVQKVLEYTLVQTSEGVIPPWMGFWPIVVVVAAASIFLFRRLAEGGIITNRPRIAARPGTDYASALAGKPRT